jgi:hypothetical protein
MIFSPLGSAPPPTPADSRYRPLHNTFSSILQAPESSTTLSPRHDSWYMFAIAEVYQAPPSQFRVGLVACVWSIWISPCPLGFVHSVLFIWSSRGTWILFSVHYVHMGLFILHSFILYVRKASHSKYPSSSLIQDLAGSS